MIEKTRLTFPSWHPSKQSQLLESQGRSVIGLFDTTIEDDVLLKMTPSQMRAYLADLLANPSRISGAAEDAEGMTGFLEETLNRYDEIMQRLRYEVDDKFGDVQVRYTDRLFPKDVDQTAFKQGNQ